MKTQNICDAFNGGGETWEVLDALIRIENRIWESAGETLGHSSEERAYFDAYDIVRNLHTELEFGWPATGQNTAEE
jgi:hypothetical protein